MTASGEMAALEWPDGLHSFDVQVPLGPRSFDVPAFEAALEDRIGRKLPELIDLTFRGSNALRSVVADITVSSSPADSESQVQTIESVVTLEFSRPMRDEPSDVDLGVVLEMLDQHVSETARAETPSYAFGTFALARSRWRPLLTFPLPLPGYEPDDGPPPQMSGFEVTYTDPKYPLRRAGISTYGDDADFWVHEAIVIPFKPVTTLVQRSIETFVQHLGTLAVRVKTAKDGNK
jgi:hypothetical protein